MTGVSADGCSPLAGLAKAQPPLRSVPARLLMHFPRKALAAIDSGTTLQYLKGIESKMFSFGASLLLGQAVVLKVLYVDILLQASSYAPQGLLAHLALIFLVAAVWSCGIAFTVKQVGWGKLPTASLLRDRFDDDVYLGRDLRRSIDAHSLWVDECIYLLAHPQGRARLCAASLGSCPPAPANQGSPPSRF